MSFFLPLAGIALLLGLGRRRESRAPDVTRQIVDDARETVREGLAETDLRDVEDTAPELMPDASPAPSARKPPRRRPGARPGRRKPPPPVLDAAALARATERPQRPGQIRRPKPGAPPSQGPTEAQLAAIAAAAAKQAEAQEAPAPIDVAPTGTPAREAMPAAPPLVTPTPEAQPARSAPVIPEGYDPDAARRQANEVATHLRKSKYDYSRKRLRDWQRHAGIDPDGIYGFITAGALRYFGAERVPRPLSMKRSKAAQERLGLGPRIKEGDPDSIFVPVEER